jgi:hypothetical protein
MGAYQDVCEVNSSINISLEMVHRPYPLSLSFSPIPFLFFPGELKPPLRRLERRERNLDKISLERIIYDERKTYP